jgi:hypothetical protein
VKATTGSLSPAVRTHSALTQVSICLAGRAIAWAYRLAVAALLQRTSDTTHSPRILMALADPSDSVGRSALTGPGIGTEALRRTLFIWC